MMRTTVAHRTSEGESRRDAPMFDFEPGSYRDRGGRVFSDGQGRVFRALSAAAWSDWTALRETRFFRDAVEQGRIIGTEPVADSDPLLAQLPGEWKGVLAHRRLPVVSYPYEWTFGMLRDAALLHLDVLSAALDEDFILKDGRADNVQWQGTRPVFIDVGSFERWQDGRPWAGYRQFCQTFLYPLMLQAYKQISFHPWLRGRLEGISPQECRRMMSLRDLFRRGVWPHVVLHAWLDGGGKHDAGDAGKDLSAAGFGKEMLRANIRGLTRILRGLSWSSASSVWSDYTQTNGYSAADQQTKSDFVRACVRDRRWKLAWDIGCNTGTYSRIAAENCDQVLSLDADHPAVERFYQSLKQESGRLSPPILPLVCNVADQAGGLGWRGREHAGLATRGRPDLILCLAIVHHLAISHGVPLDDLLGWFSELQCSLIIEFVDRNDLMVERLLQRRTDGAADYHRAAFEQALRKSFDVARTQTLETGTRTLYFAHPRSAR